MQTSSPASASSASTPASPSNTRTLVGNAVRNSTTRGLKALGDRVFTAWFNRLVYAQIWEDPVVDLEALQLQPGSNVLTISSGGCNALAYLAAQPAAVHAVDLNAAHIALIELKARAMQHLPSHAEVVAFLGDAARPDNVQRYRRIAPYLSASARAYWEGRGGMLMRRRHQIFSHHAYRHGLLGRFIGTGHALTRLLGGDLAAVARARTLDEQRELFERHVAPVFRHRLVRFLAHRPTALYSLGIPPAQYEALRRDAMERFNGDVVELLADRMRRLACDYPLGENCFAAQAFARRYDPNRPEQLPMYLQPRHYQTLTQHLDRLHWHHTNLTHFLQGQPAGSFDAYLFLDAQDWMDASQLTELWTEVNRTAKPGARVVFRTGGSESPLEGMLPADVLAPWSTDRAYNRDLYARDRSAIYGGMHLYVHA